MRFNRRNKTSGTVSDPWNDERFIAHDKPVTLRQLRYHADNIGNQGIAQSPTEKGLALTILSLCDEIDRLHRGPVFRVEVACDGYAALLESDVPHDYDSDSYTAGAAAAAESIRAALRGE